MSQVHTRTFLRDGGLHVVSSQDCQDIIDNNKALQSQPQQSDWGRHIADIPNIIIIKWMNEEGADVLRMSAPEFGAFIRKKLNDPDWRHLRVDK